MKETVINYFKNLPVLETERLILRKFEKKDIEDLYEYASDEEVTRYVPFPRYESLKDAEEYIAFLEHQYKEGDLTSSWAIELKDSKKVIGAINFVEVSLVDQCAMVGYILNKQYWCKGYITEALKKILEESFITLSFHRVEARCIKENVGSSKVMEKCGMQFEGCFRDKFYHHGKFVDENYYAILKEEYLENQ